MKVNKQEVEHVAQLARLRLSDDEKDRLTEQLNSILNHFDKMAEVDTENVEATSHVIPMQNVSDADVVGESLTPEESLASAPERHDNYYVVPRIMEAD